MIAGRAEPFVSKLPLKSGLVNALLGSMLVALIVALGTIGPLHLFSFSGGGVIAVVVVSLAALDYFVQPRTSPRQN